MKRKTVAKIIFGLALSTVLVSLNSLTEAQQPPKIPRIGFISGRGIPTAARPDPNAAAFQRGLRDMGYIEGRNILIEIRYAEGNVARASTLVSELLQLKIDVLVTPYSSAINAAKQATTTIPIVMVTTVDPVATGIRQLLSDLKTIHAFCEMYMINGVAA